MDIEIDGHDRLDFIINNLPGRFGILRCCSNCHQPPGSSNQLDILRVAKIVHSGNRH